MLPTGPFPDVTAPADLYAATRRRASRRRARTAAAVASVTVLLTGGATYALLPGEGHRDSLVPATTPTAKPTDAELVAMAPECIDCSVIGRVELPSGDTFGVVREDTSVLFGTKYVLARGHTLLDALPHGGLDTNGYPEAAVTDSTGNVLVRMAGGATAVWILPFHETGTTLSLIQGGYSPGEIAAGYETQVVDTNHDGVLDIITIAGGYNTHGTRDYTYQHWTWNGTSYTSSPCRAPSDTTSTAPDCGLTSYPPP